MKLNMQNQIPVTTIRALARSVFKEATKYGFGQVDVIRLVNELMDLCTKQDSKLAQPVGSEDKMSAGPVNVTGLPLTGERLLIRSFEPESDIGLLENWMSDNYGRHFVLSSTSAQSLPIRDLALDPRTCLGIVTTPEHKPIGALAYLEYDSNQRRAELRKLIADPEYRGKGYAEEATRLWMAYGLEVLGLEKIYVSTLQANLGNIKLNERVGFHMEGLLQNELMIDGVRHDVLRMGFCKNLDDSDVASA